jgi:Tfp pilus assembly protein PilX
MLSLTAKRKLRPFPGLRNQRGAALLMVVLILVIMSAMLFFNARVTSTEQIISGNDRRAKLAQHAAEAGISHAMRYFTRNIRDINSIEDGGWLPTAAGSNHH